MQDKRMSLAAAAAIVDSGDAVGIGGMLLSRRPVSLCREVARSTASNLTFVGVSGGFETDALLGLGTVTRMRQSFLSLGIFGLAPMYSSLARSGGLEQTDETEMSVVAGLRASIAGLGFFPFKAWDDTDYLALRDDIKRVSCPYTGEQYIAFPPIELDVGFVHAPVADLSGNCILDVDHVADLEIARAARTTVVSAEAIVEDLIGEGYGSPDIPGLDVNVVVEAPMGAWPGSCGTAYDVDAAYLLDYLDAADAGNGVAFLERWAATGGPVVENARS